MGYNDMSVFFLSYVPEALNSNLIITHKYLTCLLIFICARLVIVVNYKFGVMDADTRKESAAEGRISG